MQLWRGGGKLKVHLIVFKHIQDDHHDWSTWKIVIQPYCLLCMLLYSVLYKPYNFSICFIIISILEKNEKKCCHRKSQMHHIGGWGKTVRDHLAPTLGGRLASHDHYLKERGFWKKFVM